MIHNLFIWLAAADRSVLQRCPSERARYECMGAAVLVTACLAAVSGTFALTTAMRVPVAAAVVVGILWGLAVMSIDRLLIAGVVRRPTWWENVLTALPRLGLALLIGAVISTPLVLRIFEAEINAQLELNHQQAKQAFADRQANDPRFSQIPQMTARVAELRQLLATSAVPVETDPTVQQRQRAFEAVDKEYQQADRDVICEKEGRCGSGEVGAGPAFREKVERRDRLRTERAAALRSLNDARADAERRLGASLTENKANARAELERLESDLERRVTERRAEEARYGADVNQDDGLLARIGALDDLRASNATLGWAYLALAMLIAALELLPVLAKLLLLLGPITPYEQVRKLIEENEVQATKVVCQESAGLAQLESDARVTAATQAAVIKATRENQAHLDLHQRLLDDWQQQQLAIIAATPNAFVVGGGPAQPGLGQGGPAQPGLPPPGGLAQPGLGQGGPAQPGLPPPSGPAAGGVGHPGHPGQQPPGQPAPAANQPAPAGVSQPLNGQAVGAPPTAPTHP